MHARKLLGVELVFTQKAIRKLKNERAEFLMVTCRGCRRYKKVIWKNKCWVINTHFRICTTSFLSTITNVFLSHNMYFTLNIYGPVKFYTCEALSHSHFQVIIQVRVLKQVGGLCSVPDVQTLLLWPGLSFSMQNK